MHTNNSRVEIIITISIENCRKNMFKIFVALYYTYCYYNFNPWGICAHLMSFSLDRIYMGSWYEDHKKIFEIEFCSPGFSRPKTWNFTSGWVTNHAKWRPGDSRAVTSKQRLSSLCFQSADVLVLTSRLNYPQVSTLRVCLVSLLW